MLSPANSFPLANEAPFKISHQSLSGKKFIEHINILTFLNQLH